MFKILFIMLYIHANFINKSLHVILSIGQSKYSIFKLKINRHFIKLFLQKVHELFSSSMNNPVFQIYQLLFAFVIVNSSIRNGREIDECSVTRRQI